MKKGKFDADGVLSQLQEANEKSIEPPAAETPVTASQKSETGVLANQRRSASAMSRRKKPVQYMHDPSRIRMWHGHNRDYQALDATNCNDLIEAFGRGAEGQRFAAIVRKVNDDPNFDYEVICGARRHWTANYRGMDLLIEIRDLTDKEAFTLQDLENRDRQDVSDLERSIDYKNALKKYFDNDLSAICSYLQQDKSNFIKLLFLAELPDQIVSAYSDKRDLKVHHGTVYKKMLESPDTKRVLLRRATDLKGKNMQGKDVFAYLKKPVIPPQQKKIFKVGNVTLAKKTPKLVQLNLDIKKNMTERELREVEKNCVEVIRTIFKETETRKEHETAEA